MNSCLLCLDNSLLIGHRSSGFGSSTAVIVLALEAPSPLPTGFLKVFQLLQVIDAGSMKKGGESFSQAGSFHRLF